MTTDRVSSIALMTRGIRRAGRVNVALLAGCLFLLGLSSAASASSVNRACLILVHSDGQTLERCVEFTEPQITGMDLLTGSGLDLNVDASNSVGVAVCRIDQEGCSYPSQACFCKCQGSPCVYWSYWHLSSGAWKYSNTGASASAVHDGDVDGWVWGAGTISSASPPPAVNFDQICALPSPTSIPTATAVPPTNTPPPPTTTPRPTGTAVPATSTPTNSPRPIAASSSKPTNTPPGSPPLSGTLPPATPLRRTLPTTPTLPPSPSPGPTAVAVLAPTRPLAAETLSPQDEGASPEPTAQPAPDEGGLNQALRVTATVLVLVIVLGGTLIAIFVASLVLLKRLF